MKAIVSALALCAVACGGGSNDPTGGGGDEADGGGSAGGDGGGGGCIDGDPFDPAALEAEVGFLASDEMRGRAPGSPQDATLRAHIADRFACLGLTPVEGSFQQEFVDSRDRPTANVVAYLPGSDPQVAGDIILIGGHHDHLGMRNGNVMNGANDNASGAATVLAVAQAVRQRAEPPRRTIVFATFGSEELGLEGSYHHAEHPPAGLPIEDMVYMINLDMIGTYFNDDMVYAFGSFEGTPARAAVDDLLADRRDLTVELGASAVEVEGEGDSDYDAFCQQDIPYLYFFTEDDECYHRACDDADRIDYPHMAAIAELTAEALLALADSELDLRAARAAVGCGERGN
jgi:hypothetical protein